MNNSAYVNPLLGISCWSIYLHNNTTSQEEVCVCVSVLWGRILLSIHRSVQRRQLFMLSLPVLSGAGDMLKMLNARCFQGDNTFMFYFLELFPLAVKPGWMHCCIQLASYRQRRWSSIGQTKKLSRSFHGWTRRSAYPTQKPKDL